MPAKVLRNRNLLPRQIQAGSNNLKTMTYTLLIANLLP